MNKPDIIYKRLFIAIKIKNTDIIESLISSMRSKLLDEKINWVQLNNLHLTLRFLGKTETSKVPAIKSALINTMHLFHNFTIETGKIGLFGSKHSPKVIWLEIKSSGLLEQLEIVLSEELKKSGFERDNQNFVAHLTLGRIPTQLKSRKYFQQIIDAHQNSILVKEKADTITLFSSKLTPHGPVYYSEININLSEI